MVCVYSVRYPEVNLASFQSQLFTDYPIHPFPFSLFLFAPLMPFFPSQFFNLRTNLFCPTVPSHVRTCSVLLFRGGCVFSAQSELWDHQEARMPRSADCGTLHEAICQGRVKSQVVNYNLKIDFEKIGSFSMQITITWWSMAYCSSLVSLPRPSVMYFCPMLTSSPSCLPIMSQWRKWWVVGNVGVSRSAQLTWFVLYY